MTAEAGIANEIIGREEEMASIGRFLEAVDKGPAALVVHGEPGIGKTALWKEGVAAARRLSFRVLTSRPSEAESRMSYSALGDLLDSAIDEAFDESHPSPPKPQREALEVALLRRQGKQSRPDQRAVSLAALAVLRALSSSAPVVVAVDDAQWLDSPSAQALKFVIRRLGDERVGILFAIRGTEADEDPFRLVEALTGDGVGRLSIGPISVEALDRILRTRLSTGLPRPVLVQLHQASGGNPFYALEIARAMERGEVRPTGQMLPVPETLKGLIRHRLRALPAQTRAALVAAAALSRPTVTLVGSAVGRGTSKAAIARGVDAGVIEVDGETIRFSHPLFGSVVYAEASAEERGRLHRRLAAIVSDPEERAWHLALSVDGPDAGVAAALDEAAAKARARGAPDAAAALAEQARRLTPAERTADARRRAVEAADFYVEAGNTERCRALLEEVVAASPAGQDRARALIRLAWTRSYQDGLPASVDLFHQALAESGEDLATRAGAEQGLAWYHHIRDVPAAQAHARAAVESARRLGDHQVLAEALAVHGFVEALSGHDASLEELERVLSIEQRAVRTPLVRPEWILGMLSQWAGDLHSARDRLEPLYQLALERGDESALPYVLSHLSRVACRLGHWQEAATLASESYELALQTGQEEELPYSLYSRALVNVCMGNVESARADAEEGLKLAVSTMSGGFELSAVLGFLELSLGDAREAHNRLAPIVEALESAGVEEPGVFRVHPDEIEALVSLGDLERAEALLAPFEERARAGNHVWAMPLAGRCRGLLLAAGGDVEGALRRLEVAIRDHERLPEPFELARTLYAKGVVERRGKRKREARASLERALALFDELGAALWSERARAELARIGGRAPAPLALTPTEARVAALVVRGSTNREAADALFMSVNTVEANLKRIYRKLGIRSRTELSATMRFSESGEPSEHRA